MGESTCGRQGAAALSWLVIVGFASAAASGLSSGLARLPQLKPRLQSSLGCSYAAASRQCCILLPRRQCAIHHRQQLASCFRGALNCEQARHNRCAGAARGDRIGCIAGLHASDGHHCDSSKHKPAGLVGQQNQTVREALAAGVSTARLSTACAAQRSGEAARGTVTATATTKQLGCPTTPTAGTHLGC